MTRGLEDLTFSLIYVTMTIQKMKKDFNHLNFVTSTKLKKVNDKKTVSHLILKISFLTLFEYAVKITIDNNPIYD